MLNKWNVQVFFFFFIILSWLLVKCNIFSCLIFYASFFFCEFSNNSHFTCFVIRELCSIYYYLSLLGCLIHMLLFMQKSLLTWNLLYCERWCRATALVFIALCINWYFFLDDLRCVQTEGPGGLKSVGSQWVGHAWETRPPTTFLNLSLCVRTFPDGLLSSSGWLGFITKLCNG